MKRKDEPPIEFPRAQAFDVPGGTWQSAPPSYEAIADMLPAILATGTEVCPLCGSTGVHQHTPQEIVIYRNGVKYGRSLTGSPSPQPAAQEKP